LSPFIVPLMAEARTSRSDRYLRYSREGRSGPVFCKRTPSKFQHFIGLQGGCSSRFVTRVTTREITFRSVSPQVPIEAL
jgi:hypothetical protein